MFMYLLTFIIISVFMIQYQLKMRLLNLELYSYKKYDFRYRKPTSHGIPNTDADRPRYNIIPESHANGDDMDDMLDEDRA